MFHMRQESSQKALRVPSIGSGCQVAYAGDGESVSPLLHGDGGRYDLVQGEANSEIIALGDILVDVDAGPGGMGLVVWIVGG
ncbi:MAG: hypothetical protein IIC99_12085 [Chloroflexi bacterium]|nr:hypothetical protein [Chloroflexota bacterium]